MAARNATARAWEPEMPDAAQWPTLRSELRTLRLVLDLSYEELGEAIGRLVPGAHAIPGVTVRKALLVEDYTPRERLLYLIVNAMPELRKKRDAVLAGAVSSSR